MAKRKRHYQPMPEGSRRRRRRRRQQPVFVSGGDLCELMLMLDEYIKALDDAKMVKNEKKLEFGTLGNLRRLSAKANLTYHAARENANSIHIDLLKKLAGGGADLLQLQKTELDYAEAIEKASKAKKEKKKAFYDLNVQNEISDGANIRFHTAMDAKSEET